MTIYGGLIFLFMLGMIFTIIYLINSWKKDDDEAPKVTANEKSEKEFQEAWDKAPTLVIPRHLMPREFGGTFPPKKLETGRTIQQVSNSLKHLETHDVNKLFSALGIENTTPNNQLKPPPPIKIDDLKMIEGMEEILPLEELLGNMKTKEQNKKYAKEDENITWEFLKRANNSFKALMKREPRNIEELRTYINQVIIFEKNHNN